jgi:Cell Wall Hydrolase
MSTALEMIAGPSLCIWRENRGASSIGMQSVLEVLQNRATRDNTTIYEEAIAKLQFSSMTAPDDPEEILWPDSVKDPVDYALYVQAEQSVIKANSGALTDITGGATDYYNPNSIKTTKTITLPNGNVIPFPEGWDPTKVVYTGTIGNQVFFREIR